MVPLASKIQVLNRETSCSRSRRSIKAYRELQNNVKIIETGQESLKAERKTEDRYCPKKRALSQRVRRVDVTYKTLHSPEPSAPAQPCRLQDPTGGIQTRPTNHKNLRCVSDVAVNTDVGSARNEQALYTQPSRSQRENEVQRGVEAKLKCMRGT
ncbi:uncharacterized protein WM277_002072 isoform 2-T2 [Molossus nigricans]